MSLAIMQRGDTSKPAIVFLHGASVSSWMWQPQIETLCKDYYCIAIDLPGSGYSHAVQWHSLQDTANKVAKIIQTHCVNQQAHVIGLSLGGYVAMFLLSYFPTALRSVIVSGITTRPFSKQWLMKPMLNIMCRLIKYNWVIRWQIKLMQLPEHVHKNYILDCKRMSVQMLLRVYDEILNLQPTDLHNSSSIRLLAVAGDKEQALVLQSLEDLEQHTNATTALATQASHIWNAEYPEAFTNMIAAWITNQALPKQLSII